MDRNITFGKYKGQPIKKLILTHIGYIMWCLSNLNWFKLNDEEQKLYNAVALSVMESDCDTVYPKEKLKAFINDPSAKSLFAITENGVIYPKPEEINNEIVQGVMKYKTQTRNKSKGGYVDLGGLMEQAVKMFISTGDDMTDYNDF